MLTSVLYKVNKLFKILTAGDLTWYRALLFSTAAAIEHVPVLRQLGNVKYVVDIGANRGQFALAAHHCFPEAQIISFEPLPGPVTVFRDVFSGVAKVTLHQFAIGPITGKATIHVSARDDSSSLLPIGAKQEHFFPGTAEATSLEIQIRQLTEFINKKDIIPLALLKLDVQGFELEALKGCSSLINSFDWIYAECSFVELYDGQAMVDDVIAWLREQGYVLRGIYNMTYGPNYQAVQADFLFGR